VVPDTTDAPRGRLAGRVLDATTEQPLPGASVVVPALDRGTAAEGDGRFVLHGLPTGTYTVKVSMVGYQTAVEAPVAVTSGRTAHLQVALSRQAVRREGVKVTARSTHSSDAAPTSVRTLQAEEIRRAPGAAGDVQRVMQSMPGVVVANDRQNDLIVRGGSPRQNAIFLDGIRIPNLSHFGTQGATGGPISMLDSDYLDDATFQTGGFPARYGRALSSVLSLRLREGSRQSFGASADVSMAGAGASAEGPIPGGDGPAGSWFVSGRRSYLDLIQSGIGVTAVPRYSSGQAKGVVDLGPADRLTAVGLAGRHAISFEAEDDPDASDLDNDGAQVVGGLSWRHLWGDHGTSTLSLSAVSSTYRTDAYDDGRLDYRNRSRETNVTVRLRSTWRLEPETTVRAGGAFRVTDYRHELFTEADTLNTGTVREAVDALETERPLRPSAYAEVTHRPANSLEVTAGARVNGLTLSNAPVAVSPRLSARYELVPSLFVNASWGRYHQWPALIWFTSTDTAADLEPTRATHWVAGLEWAPTPAWTLTLEGYVKDYDRVPAFRNRPMLSPINQGVGSGAFLVGPLADAATARARGLEAYARRRLTDRFFGTLSYTLSSSTYTALDGVERPTRFDKRHVASVTVGATGVDAGPLGDLGGSVKLRYATGQPTTPYDQPASRRLNRPIIDTDRVFEKRLPDYLRLDVRLDRRDNFEWGTVTSYVEMQNVTGRRNVAARRFDADDGEVETVTHWGRFFVGGVKVSL
jgi:hypothetical protein